MDDFDFGGCKPYYHRFLDGIKVLTHIAINNSDLDRVGFKDGDVKVGHPIMIHQFLEQNLKPKSYLTTSLGEGRCIFSVMYYLIKEEDVYSFVQKSELFNPYSSGSSREVFIEIPCTIYPDLGLTENLIEMVYRDSIAKFNVKGLSKVQPVGVMRYGSKVVAFLERKVSGIVTCTLPMPQVLRKPYDGLNNKSKSLLSLCLGNG